MGCGWAARCCFFARKLLGEKAQRAVFGVLFFNHPFARCFSGDFFQTTPSRIVFRVFFFKSPLRALFFGCFFSNPPFARCFSGVFFQIPPSRVVFREIFSKPPLRALFFGNFFSNHLFARCFSGDFPKDYVFIPLFALKNLVCIKLPFIFVSV